MSIAAPTAPAPTATKPPPPRPMSSKPLPPPPAGNGHATAAPAQTPRPTKTFTVKPWTDKGQGTKALLYAGEGMGKSTLGSQAPNPIFIGADDGGRKIRNPKTGKPVNYIENVDCFDDLRAVLRMHELFPAGSTAVLDTITKIQQWGEAYTIATVKTEKNATATCIEDYGYGKGYVHLTDTMRLLLADLDALVLRGVNVLLLAQQGQALVANLEGTDYLQDGPKLYLGKKGEGVRADYCEWVDHVFRIGHPELVVTTRKAGDAKGRVSGTSKRAIFTAKELHFVAKSRPVNGNDIPPLISFEDKSDDSLWQYVFGGLVWQPETAEGTPAQ